MSPVSRPSDVSAPVIEVSSWMPPPLTHSAVTTRSTSQPAVTLASRHHRGTGPRRRAGCAVGTWALAVGAKVRRGLVEAPLLVVMSQNSGSFLCATCAAHRRRP